MIIHDQGKTCWHVDNVCMPYNEKSSHVLWTIDDALAMVNAMVDNMVDDSGDNHNIMNVDCHPIGILNGSPSPTFIDGDNIKMILGNGQSIIINVMMGDAYCVCCMVDDVTTIVPNPSPSNMYDDGDIMCDACWNDACTHDV